MKFNTKFNLLLTVLFLLNCSPKKDQILQIDGTVVGTDTKSIILVKPNQDTRFDSIIEIPVIDGKFHYESKLEHPEAVDLFLTKELGRFMPLFLENEKIELTIYSEDKFDKNTVEGGNLNAEYKKFTRNFEDTFNDRIKILQDSIDKLSKNNEYFSDKAKLIYTELKEAKNQEAKIVIYKKLEALNKSGENLKPKARKLEDKKQPIYKEQKIYQENYIKNNPTIVSYSFLLNNLIYEKETIDINAAKNTFQILSKANPNHPYNELASNLIHAIENVKIGKKFTDFAAPDLNGNIIKFSEKIKGKITLLDLWATWCGPCIAKSRTMVPVYNEYKDKGFTIIGVAGEFKNTDKLVRFLDNKKWEWLNLVELDRQNAIWEKYGIDRSGGALFLINEEGIIIAKNPTAEEVKKILQANSKQLF